MFLIWAVLNTCEWFDFIMMHYPQVPLIPLFNGFVQLVQDNTVQLVMLKNYIEIVVILSTLVLWMWAWCAPICGIVLVQAIRIKFLGSNFTKAALRGVDLAISNVLPGFIYNMTVQPLKNYMSTLSGVKESLQNEKEANEAATKDKEAS